MNGRKVRVLRLPTQHANQFINVTVRYRDGSGYVLDVNPVTVEDGFELYAIFSGETALLQTASRFSVRTLEQLAARAQDHHLYQPMLDIVLAKNSLALAAPTFISRGAQLMQRVCAESRARTGNPIVVEVTA